MADIFHCGPVVSISALFDELKIGRTIDKMVRWDQGQCRMSPGTRLKRKGCPAAPAITAP